MNQRKSSDLRLCRFLITREPPVPETLMPEQRNSIFKELALLLAISILLAICLTEFGCPPPPLEYPLPR